MMLSGLAVGLYKYYFISQVAYNEYKIVYFIEFIYLFNFRFNVFSSQYSAPSI